MHSRPEMIIMPRNAVYAFLLKCQPVSKAALWDFLFSIPLKVDIIRFYLPSFSKLWLITGCLFTLGTGSYSYSPSLIFLIIVLDLGSCSIISSSSSYLASLTKVLMLSLYLTIASVFVLGVSFDIFLMRLAVWAILSYISRSLAGTLFCCYLLKLSS